MIPSYFKTPPSRAPSSAGPLWAAVVRHAQAVPPRATARTYHVAVDIWAAGAHLWRSWNASEGRTVDDWADEVLGAGAPSNHDDGVWGVPGVDNVADWPIPPEVIEGRAYSVGGLHDAFISLCAIGQAEGRDAFTWAIDTGDLLNEHTLRGRLRKGWDVVSWQADGYSYRAFMVVADADSKGFEDRPMKRWRATLERRTTREGVKEVDLEPASVIIDVVATAPVHHLARVAKEELGITGWPAIRQPRTMEWHLARAPWKFTMEEI